MLPKVFRRLFGQYMEGSIITARWQHTASGSVWTRLETTRHTSYKEIVVADRGTGLLTVSFPACRNAAVLACYLEPLGDTITDVHQVTPRLLTPTSGSFQAVITSLDATPVVEDPADGAILCITMMCDK